MSEHAARGLKIEHLAKHRVAIPLVAGWVEQEWGHLLPEATFETFIQSFAERTVPHQLPATWVALIGEQVVGTASLDPYDMTTRPEFSPWLAAVYVPPEFRGQGIGSRLVRTAVQEAAALGLPHLYLFTPDKMNFYKRLGWQNIETTHYRDLEVVIMQYNLSKINQRDLLED